MLKVADFGTSRFLEIAAHGTTVIGSPPYMAPEQFHGKAVFASDIYSLGVTMYQMLTGDAALRHAGAGRSRQADVGRAGLAAAAEEPAIPKAISDIVMRALAPDVDAPATSAPPTCSTTCWRRATATRARRTPRRVPRPRRRRAGAASATTRRASRRGCGARNPGGALLLALPQAAPRAHRPLPVLRRSAVEPVQSGRLAGRGRPR